MSRKLRLFFADMAYRRCGKTTQEVIDSDVGRYLKWNQKAKELSAIRRLNLCLTNNVEFRNVFYFRLQGHGRMVNMCRRILKPAEAVEINGDIGPGLYISHRHAVVFPQKAGKNLRVGPGVVIGKNRGGRPEIGDNVYIASNSTVIGGISIGNNVIIGAGSVVTKDVPSDSIYAGNPARFIRSMKDSPELYDEIM